MLTLSRSTFSAGLGASALSPSELRALIQAVDAWHKRLSAIPITQQWRALMPHDEEISEGELFSPLAWGAITAGASYYLVPRNIVAIDGDAMRSFAPLWRRIRAALSLTGSSAINPVGLGADSVAVSIAQLAQASEGLSALLPVGKPVEKKPRGNVGAFIFASILTIGGVAAMAVAAKKTT